MGADPSSGDLEYDSTRALADAVRVAAERIKSRIPANVTLEQVASAGYRALAQVLADQDVGAETSLEDEAIRRVSRAMADVIRTAHRS